MRRDVSNSAMLIGALLLAYILFGCANAGTESDDEYLIRVGDRVVTVIDFNNAFEFARSAYSHNLRQQPIELKNAQLRVLNQLTLELILLERAEELGIVISDSEVEKAVSDIRGDYPEGEFQQTLLESAVSYDDWKNRLKTRLIIERVTEKDLEDQVSLTPEDISKFYEENMKRQGLDAESTQRPTEIDDTLMQQLRRKKAEEVYHSWIKNLKEKYSIEINHTRWEKLTGSKTVAENE